MPNRIKKTLKYPYAPEENTMARYTRADQLRAEARRLAEQLAALERRPQEPVWDDEDPDNPNVVWFRRNFGRGGMLYTYAAVKAGGYWYVSGRVESMQRRTWEQLMDWLYASFDSGVSDYEPEVWTATEWSQL